MTDFTASNGFRVATDNFGNIKVSRSSTTPEGWAVHNAHQTQALREYFAAELNTAEESELRRSVASDDPDAPHQYRGNASGLSCWVGQLHASGMCGKRGEDSIHDPYGESWGFTAGGWDYFFVTPALFRCRELESGGEQCIRIAATPHDHEVDPRLLGERAKVVARRRRHRGVGTPEVVE